MSTVRPDRRAREARPAPSAGSGGPTAPTPPCPRAASEEAVLAAHAVLAEVRLLRVDPRRRPRGGPAELRSFDLAHGRLEELLVAVRAGRADLGPQDVERLREVRDLVRRAGRELDRSHRRRRGRR